MMTRATMQIMMTAYLFLILKSTLIWEMPPQTAICCCCQLFWGSSHVRIWVTFICNKQKPKQEFWHNFHTGIKLTNAPALCIDYTRWQIYTVLAQGSISRHRQFQCCPKQAACTVITCPVIPLMWNDERWWGPQNTVSLFGNCLLWIIMNHQK